MLRLFLFVVAFYGLMPSLAQPQTGVAPAPAGSSPLSVTPEVLNAKIKEVEATTDLDEAAKTQLTELYRKTLSALEAAQSSKNAEEAFLKARETAPQETMAIREDIDRQTKTKPEASLNVSAEAPLEEVEQVLVKEKANQAAVEAKLADLTEQLSVQRARPDAAGKRLTEAKLEQQKVAESLKAPTPEGESPQLTEARRWRLEAQNAALGTEIRKLDQELLSQSARVDLLMAQRDQASQNLERIRTRIRILEESSNLKRAAEAEQAKREAEEAQREAVGKDPAVRDLADRNAQFSEQLRKRAAELDAVAAGDDELVKQTKRIEEDFRSTRQKLEIAGLSQAVGQVLLKERRSLPNLGYFRREANKLEETTATLSLAQIQHQDELSSLRSPDEYLSELLVKVPEGERAQVRSDLLALAEQRRKLLEKAVNVDKAYLKAITELQQAQQGLLHVVDDYDEFLAENLLWIRIAGFPSPSSLQALPEQVSHMLSPQGWLDVTRLFAHQTTHSPALAFAALIFAVFLWKRVKIRQLLKDTGRSVGRPSTDRFVYTLYALGYTVLLAMPSSLLLATVGGQLAQALDATVFEKAVGSALKWVATALFFLRAFRISLEPGGVGQVHLGWREADVAPLRMELDRLMITFLPAAFITAMAIRLDDVAFGGELGRFTYIATMGVLGYFFYRVCRMGGALQPFEDKNPNSLLCRWRHVWLLLGIGIPLAMAVLALVGYLYTAATLTGRIINTIWFVLGLVLLHALVVRWLQLMRGRLILQSIRDRRDAAAKLAEAQSKGQAGSGEAAGELLKIEEPQVDLVALSEESRKLLNTVIAFMAILGLWWIWADVMPALRILDDVTLWHQTAVVGGESRVVPVTLADIGLALLIAVVAIVAVQRLPALLEIVLLQRLDMTSSGIYTVTTLSTYIISGIGIVLAFDTLGLSWSQIQWLVAALSVGIGFGLQEIVANFISGLIILLERPVRVGDIVTVGDTDGVVTKIRIRATTIRNWDRKELLVPNKEFITGRLLNWTLSDNVNRIVIIVGIAYGSDVERALKILKEVADEHERVVSDPAPMITFEGFGDNALTLILRCYLDSLDYRIATISELHSAINRKYAEAGISIAFPQRDLHLDTSRPLDIRISRGDASVPQG